MMVNGGEEDEVTGRRNFRRTCKILLVRKAAHKAAVEEMLEGSDELYPAGVVSEQWVMNSMMRRWSSAEEPREKLAAQRSKHERWSKGSSATPRVCWCGHGNLEEKKSPQTTEIDHQAL